MHLSADYPDYPEKNHRTDHRRYQVADDAARRYAEQAEEPAAKHAADDAYYKIDYQPEAASAHKFAGYKARQNSDNDIPKKTHDYVCF